jgi:hypothetical protein
VWQKCRRQKRPKFHILWKVRHQRSWIQLGCDLRDTAVALGSRYVLGHKLRVRAMLAYVVNDGRLFALKPSEWTMLIVGVAACGFLTLLF